MIVLKLIAKDIDLLFMIKIKSKKTYRCDVFKDVKNY